MFEIIQVNNVFKKNKINRIMSNILSKLIYVNYRANQLIDDNNTVE